ncbi:MAG: hypothetical protein V4857_05340 [Pseudomonadota bacterium]
MLNKDNGKLILNSDFIIGPDETAANLEKRSIIGLEDCGEVNGFRVFGGDRFKLFDRQCAITIRFNGKKIRLIEIVWIDGPANKLGYDATQQDLLNEKRQWVKMLTKIFGRDVDDTSLGADYFKFDWGLVTVNVDLRSQCCRVIVNYFWRGP